MFRKDRGDRKPLDALLSLRGKRALITGAAAGIGRAMARRFVEAGAALDLVDVDADGLAAVREETGAAGTAVHRVDLADRGQIRRLWEGFATPPDILVNNAGIYPMKPFLEVDEAFLRKVAQVNLESVVWMCQHMIRARGSRGGVIINVGSIEALLPVKEDLAHYAITKAGVIALTRSLAREYGKHFRVNAILPGGIVTPGTKGVAKELLKLDLDVLRTGIEFRSRLPVGRLGHPDEVALIALVLASDLASYVQGALIPVDGGFLSA